METKPVERVKPTAHLNEWKVVGVGKGKKVLIGVVRGHTYINDGHLVRTSLLVKLDKKNRKAETLNTLYELGEPAAEGA